MRRIREHLTYANVMATLAVILILGGGTAMAVDGPNPGQNTVGSEDIIGNEVKSDDIGNGRIFNLDIADEIITGGKLKNGTVTGDDIDESTLDVGPLGFVNSDTTPPPLPEVTLEEPALSATVPGPGRLFVNLDSEVAHVQCNPPPFGSDPVATVGLYLDESDTMGDEIPISGTSRRLAHNLQAPYHVTGVTGQLAAGTHRIRVGVTCDGARVPSVSAAPSVEAGSFTGLELGP